MNASQESTKQQLITRLLEAGHFKIGNQQLYELTVEELRQALNQTEEVRLR
ncbi:Fur-regulated basic protein FbpA [Paenalkalicoccus suaedae]|uniref:Fur-regulated basic protein FbpA n=1 Tax=Paenalkalicoccus suaedae TaxID=2592382 RepID=A0A859FBU3_9BACI|nr:Fur-regulated basic protein FbpA [Paenalkalicoccus suaedae]QKS70004.1 Fur-regulated basic protein FbpA [Paenalkalicoccus suaedae]